MKLQHNSQLCHGHTRYKIQGHQAAACMYLAMSYSYVCAIQAKECKNDVNVPSITKTPGSFHGVQYKLTELLMEHAEIEVCSYKLAIHVAMT